MRFSIIVPVYNVETYIGLCISSILSQENVELEIILVDDGSTDGSGVICDWYAASYECIQVIHQQNCGASKARNTGIRNATGDYILFVDGDDCIAEDGLQNIKKEIINEDYPDIVFLECKKVVYSSENCIIKEIPMMDGVTEEVRSMQRGKLLTYIAQLPKYPASPCTKAIKRDLFLDHNLMFQVGLLSEDLEWAVRLFLAVNSAGYCLQDYYYYRQNREYSSSSVCSERKTMDMLSTVEKWVRNLKYYHTEEEKNLIRSCMEYVFRFLIINVSTVPHAYRSNYIQRIKCCECVLGERTDTASNLIRFVYKIFGINNTSLALRCYLRLRNNFLPRRSG